MTAATSSDHGAEATVIAHSESSIDGSEVATVQLRHHRFILAEVNTPGHAKSSASSRAVPTAKQLKALLADIAYPVEFGTMRPGMQAGPPLTGEKAIAAHQVWTRGALRAIETTLELVAGPELVHDVIRAYEERSLVGMWSFHEPTASRRAVEAVIEEVLDKVERYPSVALNVHKQIANRPLETYMWHLSVHTAHLNGHGSSWENLFRQRCTPTDGSPALAQPEFYVAADLIQAALEQSTPRLLDATEAHTPYLQGVDLSEFSPNLLAAISTARCARTSYQSQAGVRDPLDDLRMFTDLRRAHPPHWAPFEHVTRPSVDSAGRIPGWRPLRHDDGWLLEVESATKTRRALEGATS